MAKETPAFVAGQIAELPKRETPKRTFNAEAANALLEVVSVAGQSASDGATYSGDTGRQDATKKAASAKRLLGHVLPEGKRSRTRVYTRDDGKTYAWAIWLTDAKPPKTAKK